MKGFPAKEQRGTDNSSKPEDGRNYLAILKEEHYALFDEFLERAKDQEFEDIEDYNAALCEADWEHKDVSNRKSYSNGIRVGRDPRKRRN